VTLECIEKVAKRRGNDEQPAWKYIIEQRERHVLSKGRKHKDTQTKLIIIMEKPCNAFYTSTTSKERSIVTMKGM